MGTLDIVADTAGNKVISNAVGASKPFFLLLSHSMPHVPV